MKPKIIFIHGMFLTAKSWEHWVEHFSALGYPCEAAPWPLHAAEPADLRADPPEGLGELKLSDLHGYYRDVLRGEDQPPVVIGHSLGGLLAQKLLADGLVSAAIGICSVAPNRMLAFDWGFLRNSASITNPFAGDDPYEMTPEGFHQNFANTLSEAQSNAAFGAYAVHESRQVLRDIMGDEGQINLKAPHAPLLLIGAEKDEIIPASLVRRNAHAYEDERSHHEYAEFTGRDHFICGAPGWEEVAAKIENWLAGHLSAVRS
ncbi:alpha/beta hydrolase [Luteolibacter sp. SL250]|uniref:alpha/beta hydrolase n=1 Tax=Luteolibacter sp. SL250 TaxID=2995170 RepID=UPI00226FC4D5|nr:alpha/beta hydrolase [Luteolibacter sp. SL250]WAC19065.1 alpha/beta hydrolase [Luteolibacter sp. SL250]